MSKSRLLMKEQPIVINKELAQIIGLNEAIVLQQIEYWININETARKESAYQDGFYWTYNTIDEWQEQFPFWSYDTVKRTLLKLRKKEILITNRFNKKEYDRTLWYRIDYDKLNETEKLFYSNSAKCPNEISCDIEEEKHPKPAKNLNSAKCPNAKVQNAPMQKCKMPRPIPEINTKITSSSRDTCSNSLIEIFNNEICELRKTTTVKFLEYVNTYDTDFIKSIIEYCSDVNIKSFAGFKKVIDSYISKNILTKEEFIKDVEAYRANKKAKKQYTKKSYNKSKVDTFNNYKQRDYDFEKLEKVMLGQSSDSLEDCIKREVNYENENDDTDNINYSTLNLVKQSGLI
ncbi:hypothetical protein [Clostridium botulinum]|uniref:hypothetical protein n=1 Tax=Clostridium botulinum TaxID=1491 RepID=UPI0002E67957|nr:hypothetical protein [Clostridium botulinum]KLU74224.1 hypothetical protein CBC3_p0221 [Clostridium botulinum V891]